ncbi:MAG: ABC transporter substrate-binding protein, partial [Coriobacteriaceae bacterium]|nr:ABC transporter substrate-binding protein [Coriobacteriaceae bacterium]
MNEKLTRRAFLGVAGSAALTLAACGGNGGGAPAPEGGSEGGEPEPEPSAEPTVGGGTLTVGSAYGPSSFDPQNCSSAFCLSANMNVMEGLYDIDFHDYSVSDGLCTGDPVWVDDNTCEITLRDGATFSTGDPVTPEDVVHSFERAHAEGMMYVSFLTMIESIEKKDDTTLTV